MDTETWIDELMAKLQKKEERVETLKDQLLEQDELIMELLDEVDMLEEERKLLNDELETALLDNRKLEREVEHLRRQR